MARWHAQDCHMRMKCLCCKRRKNPLHDNLDLDYCAVCNDELKSDIDELEASGIADEDEEKIRFGMHITEEP